MTRYVAFAALAACVGLAPLSTAAAPLQIRMGTIAPADSPWHRVLKQMGEDWRKESNGRIELRVIAGGSLGDERAMLQKSRAGVLQGLAISGAGLPEIDPGTMCLQIPLMFASYDELDYVRERIIPKLEARIAERGFVVLNWGDAGWIHFFSKTPAVTLDDLRKTKLYITAGDAEAENLYKLAGFKPVPLASTDILASLQTGMIDAFDVPPLFALSSQTFALAKNMNDIPWAPLVGATVIEKKAWEKVPEDLRPKLLAAAKLAGEKFRGEIRKLSDDAIKEMVKRGLHVVATDAATQQKWRAEAEAFWPKIRGRLVPTELFDEVKRLRDEFRAGKGPPR